MIDYVLQMKRDFYLWRAESNFINLAKTLGLEINFSSRYIPGNRTITIVPYTNDLLPKNFVAKGKELYNEYENQLSCGLSQNELKYFEEVYKILEDYIDHMNFSHKRKKHFEKLKKWIDYLEDVGCSTKLFFK